jgi:hypothetical protein
MIWQVLNLLPQHSYLVSLKILCCALTLLSYQTILNDLAGFEPATSAQNQVLLCLPDELHHMIRFNACK